MTRSHDGRSHGPAARRAAAAGGSIALLALLAAGAGGCYAPQLVALRSGLDSLRAEVDTLSVRDSVSYRLLSDTRRELGEQRDLLLSTRASTGSTNTEMFQAMSRLESKLEEVLARWQQVTRANTPVTPGSGDPTQLYDQAAQDLTQGRYTLAVQGFRDVVRRYPTDDLADNAQYGVGESFFAQSTFDSAAAEYAKVETGWPQGDKVPAALYKLALAQEKLGRDTQARRTLEDLVKRFPLAGESQLARERLGTTRRR